MDGHRHPPSSLNHNPGHAAGCDLHRAMTPLEQLWKRLTRDLSVATGGDRFVSEALFLQTQSEGVLSTRHDPLGSLGERGHCNTPERLKALSLTGR